MQVNQPRRPGELVFNIIVFAASLFLFYTAYGIAGFEALSSPGAIPMVTTATMVVTSAMITVESLRKSAMTSEKIWRDILPLQVIASVLLIVAYALLLKPLGFLPTTLLFLVAMIHMLKRGSLAANVLIAFGSVVLIWVIFRLVFSVLMPAGIVPEAEILAFFRNLASGGN